VSLLPPVAQTALADLWLDFIFWGGGVGLTVGLIGAACAAVLARLGYRRVTENRDPLGWDPAYEVGPLPSPTEWFSVWTLVGTVVGGAMGVVFWVDGIAR
jgi:hypothetical protein